ncbi:hypothetical protein VNO80_30741 [Phaseolus coccineus]|uniref:Uncharacterized protein n=1 Tax=Phaseolus coccineus TaxID=3886 RepID=A0AAN9LDG9_PHACN
MPQPTSSTRECVSNTQRTTAGARPPVCVVERAGGRLGASGRKPVSPDKTLTPALHAPRNTKLLAKCDTWCELQNPVNHRVFERKLRPKPLG